MYTYIPSFLDLIYHPSLTNPPRSSQSTEPSSLCYKATSHQLSIFCMVVYICQCHFPNLFHPPLCPTPHPHVYMSIIGICVSISSVQLLSRVWLFATPWTAARQVSLSITNSRSPPKSMSIESMHPTISSSVVPFSCPQSFPASGSFQMSQLFASGGQSIGASVQHQSFQRIFRTDFL